MEHPVLPLDVKQPQRQEGSNCPPTPGPRPNRITGRPVRDCSERVLELTVWDRPIPWKRPEEHRYVLAGSVAALRRAVQTRKPDGVLSKLMLSSLRVKRYEHDDVRDAKARIAWAARHSLPPDWRPLDGGVRLLVIAYLDPPDRVLMSRTPELELPAVRPDDDNLGKLVRDALNGVVWVDDGRIVDGTTRKRYALDGQPRWRILVDRCWRECVDDQPEELPLPLSEGSSG